MSRCECEVRVVVVVRRRRSLPKVELTVTSIFTFPEQRTISPIVLTLCYPTLGERDAKSESKDTKVQWRHRSERLGLDQRGRE